MKYLKLIFLLAILGPFIQCQGTIPVGNVEEIRFIIVEDLKPNRIKHSIKIDSKEKIQELVNVVNQLKLCDEKVNFRQGIIRQSRLTIYYDGVKQSIFSIGYFDDGRIRIRSSGRNYFDNGLADLVQSIIDSEK